MKKLWQRPFVRRGALIGALILASLAGIEWYNHFLKWHLWLRMTGAMKVHDLPVNTEGYIIEELPLYVGASFARAHEVYLIDGQGIVYKSDDRDPVSALVKLGDAKTRAFLIFVSSRGTIFVSGPGQPLLRSIDGGVTWEKSHDWSFWRMTEDNTNGTLYAGNYSHRNDPVFNARVFRSTDEGTTWQTIFEDERLDHVHSIRWDAKYRRLYISTGDTSRYRGQAYSDDEGRTWHWLNNGSRQGHTDIAISDHFVFWGSDDNLGRLIRAPRDPAQDGKTITWAPYHHVWWVVAEKQQIYAGTYTEHPRGYSGAFLMASADEGKTWQKLMEVPKNKDGIASFNAESRVLSAEGWLYFTTSSRKSFRVRRAPGVVERNVPGAR